MTNRTGNLISIYEGGRERVRLSEPQEGLSLAAATEARARHVRKAVALLADGFDAAQLPHRFRQVFAPRWELDFGYGNDSESLSSRAAWNLVCVWLLARHSGVVGADPSFEQGEAWFTGESETPALRLSSIAAAAVLEQAHRELLEASIDQDFWDLFPYVLEEHGPGSRASVLCDPTTKPARLAKKRHGVFYTPADVADFMVGYALGNYAGDVSHAKCLDPACGTGVFLLSLCRGAEERAGAAERFDRLQFVTSNLYGCDISRQAIDACTFVLLHHCLADTHRHGISPWAAWHAIRLNLAVVDSLLLCSDGPSHPLPRHGGTSPCEERKQALLEAGGAWVDAIRETPQNQNLQAVARSLLPGRRMIRVRELFGEGVGGFGVLVGNPPYTSLAKRPDYELLASQYHCLARGRRGRKANTFLLFVEMMWRLTVPGQNSEAMVVPLSIAYNSAPQYQDTRSAMAQQGGHWQFAFFDREPHALFGEAVKTRNAILFRSEDNSTPPRGEPAAIATGPLRRWTSRTRRQLFESIEFTKLGAVDITGGIPKLQGDLQVGAHTSLRQAKRTLQSFCRRIGRCGLKDALNPGQANRIFVGGTAYNFLNVFYGFSPEDAPQFPLSESPVHYLEFMSEIEAAVGFALLSSRLVFWLWHVEADGFHVTSSFLKAVPFHQDSFSPEQMRRLSGLGEHLWKALQLCRFTSVNRGKTSYTFRPLACNEERDAIDSVLISAAALPAEFGLELKSFVRRVVVVDEKDPGRRHVHDYFREQ